MNYYLQTEDAFPSTQTRSEVIIRREVELSPIETAIEAVRVKNSQIQDLISLFSDPSNSNQSLNSLTMALNGVIDAEVNGGVKKYQEAFFTDEYCRKGNINHIQQLKVALHESLPFIQTALSIHKSKCPENLNALQEKMECKQITETYTFSWKELLTTRKTAFFEKMKTTIETTCK